MHIKNTIETSQFQQHLVISFEVPSNSTQLTIDFEYEPHITGGFHNLVTLSVFDPKGARGEGHKHAPKQRVMISETGATPGYIPGVLPAGIWTIMLNTHMVLEPITYHMDISFAAGGQTTAAPAWQNGITTPRGQGWYRGDLHSHTLHSDADWDVPDLVAYARAEHLDFMTLSDHNTIAPLAQMDSLSADDLLTMGGMELTTYYGHALALGTRQYFDWRLIEGERTMPDIHDEVVAAGALFIIAHPCSVGNPACTGCDWTYADMMPGKARFVEVWNGNWDEPFEQNEKGVQLWYTWLNQGYRIRATGGSDIHGQPDQPTTYGRNVVYAESLSEHAILDGIRQGHLYVSQYPRLELTGVTQNGQHAMMGDTLSGSTAEMTAHWDGVPTGARLRWIVDGSVYGTSEIESSGQAAIVLGNARWCVVELRAANNSMLAITNPIFLGSDWR